MTLTTLTLLSKHMFQMLNRIKEILLTAHGNDVAGKMDDIRDLLVSLAGRIRGEFCGLFVSE